jgi:hypothetical protein
MSGTRPGSVPMNPAGPVVVCRPEQSTCRGLKAELGEDVAGKVLKKNALAQSVCNRGFGRVRRTDHHHGGCVGQEVAELTVGRIVVILARVRRFDVRELREVEVIRISDGQRPEQDCVHQPERSRSGADR